jgi:acetylornithine deacetylase
MAEQLMLAQVGVIWFQVQVRGRPAHVAVAGGGANAIEACFPIMQALHRLEHNGTSAATRHSRGTRTRSTSW